MMNSAKKIISCVILILLFTINHGSGQSIKSYADTELKKELDNIFESYPSIKSFELEYHENKLYGLVINEYPLELIEKKNGKKRSFYSQLYDGDIYYLNEKYPLLAKYLKTIHIQDSTKKRFHNLVLNPESITYYNYIGHAGVNAEFNHQLLKEFIKQMETNYNDFYVAQGDSIFILQAQVGKDGILSSPKLFHGNNSSLYDFFLKNYDEYVKLLATASFKNIRNRLVLPHLASGTPFVGLFDIYFRINSDKTFTVSGCGRERIERP